MPDLKHSSRSNFRINPELFEPKPIANKKELEGATLSEAFFCTAATARRPA
jgi:hypothetical protein